MIRTCTKRSALATLMLLIIGLGCSSTDEKTGPEPEPERKTEARPSPLESLVTLLEHDVEAYATSDPDGVLLRIRSTFPTDPEPLLVALSKTGIVLAHEQNRASAPDLKNFGLPEAAPSTLPILQKVILDGGEGIYFLVYFHSIKSTDMSFKANPGDVFKGDRSGDVVDLESRLIRSVFLPYERVFQIDRARARLESPDWRVSVSCVDILMRGMNDEEGNLRRKGLDLLKRISAGNRRSLAILSSLGDAPVSPLSEELKPLAKQVGTAYLDWARGKGEEQNWKEPLESFFERATSLDHSGIDRLAATAAGLSIFGHNSDLPKLTAGGDLPRNYVKIMTPRLDRWFTTRLSRGGLWAFEAMLLLLEGADPYLRATWLEERKPHIIAGLLDGIADAEPVLRLRGIIALETLTGCVFPRFDPFGTHDALTAAVETIQTRYARTTFTGHGEELTRKKRLAAVRRGLEAIGFRQRGHFQKHGRYASGLLELFGDEVMLDAAGFEPAPGGGLRFKSGFSIDISANADTFRAVARGPLWDQAPPITIRYDVMLDAVEILPG